VLAVGGVVVFGNSSVYSSVVFKMRESLSIEERRLGLYNGVWRCDTRESRDFHKTMMMRITRNKKGLSAACRTVIMGTGKRVVGGVGTTGV
jgi:hypothetical protein